MSADREIDTLLEREGQIKGEIDPAHLPLLSTMAFVEAPSIPAGPLENTFKFKDDLKDIGYGELVRIALRLVQTADGMGFAYLSFTQQMRCRRSDVVTGPDLLFSAKLTDSHGAYIRDLSLGAWDRRCGEQFVELRESFSWIHGSINPVQFAASVYLNCIYKVRVHHC
jgi:hypothetical protein